MSTIQLSNIETVSSTEALWSLIVSQKKSVQKTLASRLHVLLSDDERTTQEHNVRESLMSAAKEVCDARGNGKSLPDARYLFDDIDNE